MHRLGVNKKGSEMIEAAVVLPLLLLAVISIIYLGLFCYNLFMEQLEVQRVLLEEAKGDASVFSILREDAEIGGISDGLFKGGFGKSYSQRLYIINEEIFVRGGSLIEAMGDE